MTNHYFCHETELLNINSFRFGHESYYFNENAITGGLEDRGIWTPQASELLGLKDEVTQSQFQDFVVGIDPVNHEPFERGLSPRKNAGYDFLFSAPKSVSILGLLSAPEVENKVRDAHDVSVRKAMDFISSNCLYVSRSYDGQLTELKTTGILGATFYHKTSRLNDPHIHSHAVIANLAQGTDSRFSAARLRTAFLLKRHVSSIYHISLRNELTNSLNISWDRYRYGLAEISGIDSGTIFAFSKRRRELLEFYSDKAIDLDYFLKAKAVIDPKFNRPKKDLDNSLSSLREIWTKKLNRLQLSVDDLLNNVLEVSKQVGLNSAATPPYVKDLIGDRPLDKRDRSTWSKTAAEIEIFRKRWGVTDELRPLGKSALELMKQPDFSLKQLDELKRIQNNINDISKGMKKQLDLGRGL